MHKNSFDIVMAHIEENVTRTTEEIKREIPNLIGRHSRAFNEHFKILTDYTLDYYIKQRRLVYAAQELASCCNKTICDIALEYQFSDQSSFSRAVKEKFGVTPNEIRKEGLWLDEERFYLKSFTDKAPDTQVSRVLRRMENYDHISAEDVDLILEIEQLEDDYGFDLDTCYQIADLSERLGIPTHYLAEFCFGAMITMKSDPCYIPPYVEVATALGIDTDEELEAICNHYKCEYYELDEAKVYLYRKQVKKQQ